MQANDKKIYWYRTVINKEDLRELSRKDNIHGIVYTTLHLTLILLTGISTYACFAQQYYILGMLLLLCHGIFFGFLGWCGAGHELLHETVFKTKSLNIFFVSIYSFLMWNNLFYHKESHRMHHAYTMHNQLDGEFNPSQTGIKGWSWLWYLIIDLPNIYRTIKIVAENSFNVIKGEWGPKLFPLGSNKRKKVVLFARTILLGHLSLVIIFIYFDVLPLILCVTLAPFICSFINKSLTLSQHIGLKTGVNDFRLNSRTVLLEPFWAFLYWQMNYHIEHHMYPTIPFYNLKKLNLIIRADLPEPINGIRSVISFVNFKSQT